MRSVLKILCWALAIGPVAAVARVTVPEVGPEQYHAIPQRNVFALRPPASPPALTNPPAPLPKITLTGITTILGNKRALMKVAPAGAKTVEAGKEQSLILTEGQREGEVEVLQIDERAGSVKVNNSGTVMTLTFEKDGAKLPATPAPLAVPIAPPPLPGTVPNPYLPARGVGQMRTPRTPGFGAITPPVPGTGAAPVGGVPTPTGATSGPAQNSILADQQLSAEEQAIVNAFQRQENGVNVNAGNLPLPTAPEPANGTPQLGIPVFPAGGGLQGTRALVPQ